MRCTELHNNYITLLNYTSLNCTALHTVLFCTSLHCTILHCTTLQYTSPHSAALHCTVHLTALHCTTKTLALYQQTISQFTTGRKSTQISIFSSVGIHRRSDRRRIVCTALRCSVLGGTELYFIVLYCVHSTLLQCTVRYNMALQCTRRHWTLLHCTVQYCIACTKLYFTVRYGTVLHALTYTSYCSALYSTAWEALNCTSLQCTV